MGLGASRVTGVNGHRHHVALRQPAHRGSRGVHLGQRRAPR